MRNSKVQAITPDPRLALLLPRLTFADAYRVTGPAPALNARRAALAVFSEPPGWIALLMSLRNRFVRGFGLKTPDSSRAVGGAPAGAVRVGIFKVITESAEEMLLGLDDRHLDFRVAVSVQPAQGGTRQVTVTTLVRTHNVLGRTYMRVVLPFHRLIVRRLLQRAAVSWV